MGWWQELNQLQQILFAVGVTSAIVFAVMTLLTFSGLHFDGTLDTDHHLGDGGGMSEYFSLRNALAFFTGMSWVSLAFLALPLVPSPVAVAIGCAAGVGLVLLNVYIMGMLATLHVEGNLDMSQAIGCRGQVTLTIPGNMLGLGKVSVHVNGRTIELIARTAEETDIGRHETVDVVELLARDEVRVERADTNN